jgi:fibro-slime domain-containing protein
MPIFSDAELEPDDEDSCDSVLPVTFRDFSQAHPDFEMAFPGDEPRLHLVQPQLGVDGKPVFLDSVGCPRDNQRQRECNTGFHPTEAVITSRASFDQWYRTIGGTNVPFEKEITLAEASPGSGIYQYGSNAFFPLTPTEGFGETPPGQGRNFLFTTEIHLTFFYQRGQVFTFRGDDDLWIFINGKLALDLGGMHGEREAKIDFDAQAAELGIVAAGSYTMDLFHAERHTSASNFYMETNIACFSPAIVR